MNYVKENRVTAQFHPFKMIRSDLEKFLLSFTSTKHTNMLHMASPPFQNPNSTCYLCCVTAPAKLHVQLRAAETALKYAFAHHAHCACTPYPLWGHVKTWLPPLLNIDVLGGLRWVNKSWNTDNTTFKEMESMWTFVMCDAWMLRQRWESTRGMHANMSNRVHKRT